MLRWKGTGVSRGITVAVVTWNSERLVPALSKTLRKLQPFYRILVSDNASDDGTVKLLRERVPGAEFLLNPRNGGFGYGNNRALEVCRTDYMLLLNSDASIEAEDLEVLARTLRGNTALAGVQPLLRLWGWPMVTLSAGCSMNEYGRGYDIDSMHFQPFPDRSAKKVPCITAALSLFRTDALRKVGGFDERMFMYFEDIDLSLRLRAGGMDLLLQPEAEGLHMMGASSGREAALRWELRSSAYLARKYLGGPDCGIPGYWMRREWRIRMYCMLSGIPWLWRIRAVSDARRAGMDGVKLPREVLGEVLAPRPLRMPRPRFPAAAAAEISSRGVKQGPGWRGNLTGPWGFGCLEVPSRGGRLAIDLRSCDISGSVGLWSRGGCLGRTFIGTPAPSSLSADVPQGLSRVYLVPDRPEQVLELEKADYE